MKILVYDDSLEFGGHQIMACQGVEALAEDPSLEVAFISNPHNKRLACRIAGIKTLHPMETPCATRRFQGFRNHFNRQGIRILEKEFKAAEPDLVLCIQGDIEQSSQAVLAACRAGIECVSYIAVPHRLTDMRAKLGSLRDRTNQYLLNQPDRYITISESMKRLLIERGVTKPITIVPNGIPAPLTTSRIPHSTAHTTLGLIGRIEFKQKRQDFMIKTFCRQPEVFQDCRLLIAGNGPDEDALKQLVSESPRCNDITLLPWQDDVEPLYQKIDVLMLPSRYEGVPLVMLEALVRGIPVIGSACDGMKDILPEAWMFEFGNADALALTYSNLRTRGTPEMDALRQHILSEHSLDAFRVNFLHAASGRLPEG